MTATPSSPMTNPVFAPAGALDLGLEIAAQTFGPTCFRINAGSAASWALGAPDAHRKRILARNRRPFIVQLLSRMASCLPNAAFAIPNGTPYRELHAQTCEMGAPASGCSAGTRACRPR